jgi:8-oxo-dGTP pyrophosphatase MutT (NUDIX family)
MYKVFINDKQVILSNQFFLDSHGAGVLVYEFSNRYGLEQTISRFIQETETRKLIIINRKNFDLLYDDFKSLFMPVVAAGGIVYHPYKGMLWILRHNRWDLPKGKIDKNEEIESAAVREVEEETGLKKVRITDRLGLTHHAYREKGQFILKISYWFKMETQAPDAPLIPQLNEGITRVEWADEISVNNKISDTYASLQELARDFIKKHTNW